MKTSTECAMYCEDNNIILAYSYLPCNQSFSCEVEDELYVVIDETGMTEAEKRTHMAHEIGHCMTGALYKPYSPLISRSRCEYKANKWAIKKLLPKEEMEQAFKDGYTEAWQLAEHFNVTEELVRFACYEYFDK